MATSATKACMKTDMCLWGLGVNTLPDQVCAMGGKFLWNDDKETPELLSTAFKFTRQNKMIQFENPAMDNQR